MALTYNKTTRDLSIKGVLALNNGSQINLTSEDIVSYTSTGSTGYEGLPLGTVEAVSYNLTLKNVGRRFTPSQLDNAKVYMYIGLWNGSEYVYDDFGVWYVNDSSAPEQSVAITLNGFDALATRFSAVFEDDEDSYPSTIGSLAQTVCVAAGIRLARNDFLNAGVEIKKMPGWSEETTLRDVLSYCAICAAGFVRMTRNGQVDIVSYADSKTYALNPGMYQTFTATGGYEFDFNGIEVFLNEDDDERSKFYINNSITPNATNTIQIDYNPLITNSIAQSIANELNGISLDSGELMWGGDPAVQLGDIYEITDLKGVVHHIMVTNQSFSFGGGLNVVETCTLPALNSNHSATYSTSTNMYDAQGNIRATRISGLDKKVITATAGHFDRLTSESIETDSLVSAFLSALELYAGTIDASDVKTDVLTATVAKIVEATIDKINAGTIKTDELYSALAEIFALRVSTIDAESIRTDKLAAELARITVLAAGTATFDRATVEHLVAEAMNLEFGVAGQVFIRNLAVDYAQMVSAAIGNLCIRASDGSYWRIDVSSDGSVSATPAQPDGGEIAAGQTSDGRVILETNITARNLNTTNLLATYALVNRIDATRIDVDQLFAREAFVDLLRTSRIIGGQSLEMIVDGMEEGKKKSRVFRQDEWPSGDDGVELNDLLVFPSTGEEYQAVEEPETGLQFAMDGEGNLYYATANPEMYVLEMRGNELYAGGLMFSVARDGTAGAPYGWMLVRDRAVDDAIAAANAAVSRPDFERVIRLDKNTGLHIGDNQSESEVLIDSASVNIVFRNVKTSTFSDKFVRLDNMEIRKVRGGLAVSVYGGENT